ncbi:MAG TPA: long-chain fatty acid--CoA ligase [Deltaproteobacteria bacterium]|nr:long-chain fatty acid--CoA ligase [Deltaproteobacteria bacterium]HQH99893.1 long-chain fatty acid--CoA ligase [Deltaproteobacteria bacterium]
MNYMERPWLSSYPEGVQAKVNFEELCIPDFLERSARDFPDNTAVNFLGCKLTFRQLKDTVDRFAECLLDLGIRKGDSVAIILPNTIQCVAAYYAILKVGGIAVMNNPLYSDKELLHQYNDSGAKVLVTIDLLANRMIDLRPKTSIENIVVASIADYLPIPGLAADVKEADRVHRWKKVIEQYPPVSRDIRITMDDVGQYQYTGGTTGVSKGVELTHGNLSKNVQQLSSWFTSFQRGGEVMLGALPFFHVFGLNVSMNYAVYMAWENVLVPKPQPDKLIEALEKFKPTFLPMVPTMYIGILNHPKVKEIDLSHIAGCFCGSAPLPVDVIKQFEEKTGAIICEGFGMTESSPATHVNPSAKGKTKPGSIGIPLPDTECRIVDINDRKTDVPVGKSGELIIRGPQVMRKYKGMPAETKEVLRDGWLHTGDIAYMDEDGYFFIVDRLKDMIISGGYNIYPRDIDEVLYQHPKVQEACAIGVPHPSRGESVKVFIVLKAGQKATQEEIIDFCKDKLAKYKWPEEVEFREALPKSTVGKILRKDLRMEELAKRK